MAAPNIVNVSTITGKSALANVTTSFANLVVNSTSSGKVFKINSLYLSNIDGLLTSNVSIGLNRGGFSYSLANTMAVPSDSTLTVVVKDTAFYLEEGDYVEVKADANNRVHAICSYEELS